MTEQLLTYVVLINLVTLVLCVIDRILAAHRFWRVPEKLLLSLAWIGGAMGAKYAQLVSGHKKLKHDFSVNLNLIIILQIGLGLAVWSYQFTGQREDQDISALQSWLGEGDKPKPPKRFGPGSGKN